MFLSYRNQSVDLQSKSTDWFLHDGNIGRYKVNLRDNLAGKTKFLKVFHSTEATENMLFHYVRNLYV